MKLASVVRVGACAVTVLALLGCQDPSRPPVAPEDAGLEAAIDEINSSASGAVKVDSNCGGSGSCSDKDREDNTIAPGSSIIVWVVDGSGTIGSYADCVWYAFDNGAWAANGSFTGEVTCDSKLSGFFLEAPNYSQGQSGSLRLEVWCNWSQGGTLVGSDSYLSTSDSRTCFK